MTIILSSTTSIPAKTQINMYKKEITDNYITKNLYPSTRITNKSLNEISLPSSNVHTENSITNSTSDSSGISLMNSPWPMLSYNSLRIGRSPHNTTDNPGIEKWRFKCDWVEAGIVIDSNGIIYLGDFSNHVYAVNPDGTLKWRYKTSDWIWATPAIAEDGTIYIGSMDYYMYALYPNGTLKWSFEALAPIFSSPAIAYDGTIYFGDASGRLFAVNSNGTEQWHYDAIEDFYSDPGVGLDGTIYIGSWDNYFYALNPNGTLKWRFPTGNHIKGPPSIADDGTIYIGSWDGYLYALHPNGTMKWRCKVGSGTETTPAIATDGTIYVGGDELYAINPNGTMKWIFNLGTNRHIFQSCPAISAEGTIYVGVNNGDDGGGEILAVNPDGTQRWRKSIACYHCDSSPAIASDGTVYIGCTYDISKGYLHAFGEITSNQPPLQPIITGDQNGFPGRWCDIYITGTDPDNNPIQYSIDWDDGTTTNWTREHASGETLYQTHTWTQPGTYTIQAKTRDILGVESILGQTTIQINGHVLTQAFIIGKIDNYEYIDYRDEIQFTATKIWILDNQPILIKRLTHGEKIYTGYPQGILTSTHAIGFFNGYLEQ